MDDQLKEQLRSKCMAIEPTGSRYICDPPPMDTDEDWIILITLDQQIDFCNWLCSIGFNYGGSAPLGENREGDKPFSSFRRDYINLIVTWSSDEYERFTLATKIAKRFNLLNKLDRIMLFEAILYGNEYIPPGENVF